MSIILSLIRDRRGNSTVMSAVMIGLTSSAILVVVRVGVSMATG